jgi:hypothetical protein
MIILPGHKDIKIKIRTKVDQTEGKENRKNPNDGHI